MKSLRQKSLIFFTALLLLAGCTLPAPLPTLPVTVVPTVTVLAEPIIVPTTEATQGGEPKATAIAGDLAAVAEYNLGETTIVQANFPEDSRFRYMPVRLNGVIAAPTGESGPYPVVVILHGNHPGCPIPPGDEVDRWPCAPEDERPNYRGFTYLAQRLAEQGYVVLSININAENTFGFGEPFPGERLQQLVDLHLKALSEAGAGGVNDFGVELKDRVDLSRLAFFGHSRGGEGAYWLIKNADLAAPDAFARLGYGPVGEVLMIAPAATQGGVSGSPVPLAVILPACDSDVMYQEGQLFYEEARLDPGQTQPATSVWLEQANHNYFNETLSDETIARPDRPDCNTILQPDEQRDFLVDYANDFLTNLFSQDQAARLEAQARLGLDAGQLAVDSLYGQTARVAAMAARADRQPLLVPSSLAELETNLAGGSIRADGVATHYCEAGYFVPAMKPGSEPCKRVNLNIPGHPAMLVVSWEQPGGALRISLPEGSGDLSGYEAISLRAAVDPLSELNAAGSSQAFTVQLTDSKGKTASVQTRPDEPALQFPAGYEQENEFFEGGLFSGRVPLTTIRVLLSDFSGIDLTQIREIALLFDQTPSGSLFIGDVEWAR